MNTLRTAVAAACLFAVAGFAQAQQAPDANKPDPAAATSTGTSTSQSEMNRGVPGVNVDVGSHASNGVISGDVDHNTNASNVTNDANSSGTSANTDSTTTNVDTTTTTTRHRARADRG
jgi:hypothetical protein